MYQNVLNMKTNLFKSENHSRWRQNISKEAAHLKEVCSKDKQSLDGPIQFQCDPSQTGSWLLSFTDGDVSVSLCQIWIKSLTQRFNPSTRTRAAAAVPTTSVTTVFTSYSDLMYIYSPLKCFMCMFMWTVSSFLKSPNLCVFQTF